MTYNRAIGGWGEGKKHPKPHSRINLPRSNIKSVMNAQANPVSTPLVINRHDFA